MTLQITQEQAIRLGNSHAFRKLRIVASKGCVEKNTKTRDTRNEKILKLVQSGKYLVDIASECGCSAETVRQVKNQFLKISEKKNAQNQKIEALLKQGNHPQHIAKVCEVSTRKVYKVRGKLLSVGVEMLGAVPIYTEA